jgi:hypothetical protein
LKEPQITQYIRYWEFAKSTHEDSNLQDLSSLRQWKAASVTRSQLNRIKMANEEINVEYVPSNKQFRSHLQTNISPGFNTSEKKKVTIKTVLVWVWTSAYSLRSHKRFEGTYFPSSW